MNPKNTESSMRTPIKKPQNTVSRNFDYPAGYGISLGGLYVRKFTRTKHNDGESPILVLTNHSECKAVIGDMNVDLYLRYFRIFWARQDISKIPVDDDREDTDYF